MGAIGIRPTLALTLLPGLLAALAIATLVRERPHTPRPEQKLWASLQAFPSSYRRFLFGVGIAGLGDFSNTLLILWAGWTGPEHQSRPERPAFPGRRGRMAELLQLVRPPTSHAGGHGAGPVLLAPEAAVCVRNPGL